MVLSHLLGLEASPWEHQRLPKPMGSITTVTSRELGGTMILGLQQFAQVSHLQE